MTVEICLAMITAFAAGIAIGLIEACKEYKRGRVDGVKRATEVVKKFVENEKRRELMLKSIAKDQECRSSD